MDAICSGSLDRKRLTSMNNETNWTPWFNCGDQLGMCEINSESLYMTKNL